MGSLEVGKLANFLITTESIFNSNAKIIENWIQGNKFDVNASEWNSFAGKYKLTVNNAGTKTDYTVEIKKDLSATIIGTDTLAAKIAVSDALVKISFPEKKGRGVESIRLSGVIASGGWNGFGTDTKGGKLTWSASLVTPATAAVEEKKAAEPVKLISKVTYPFVGLGNETIPQQETILIKNATVLTNEKEGNLQNTDVLLKAGKIAKIGKELTEAGARVVDGTGKYLSAGIIDEHSHIAALSINEGSQSTTA